MNDFSGLQLMVYERNNGVAVFTLQSDTDEIWQSGRTNLQRIEVKICRPLLLKLRSGTMDSHHNDNINNCPV